MLFQHGGLSIKHERDSALRPIFQLSKFARNPEFLTTPLDAYENATSSHSLSWDQKTEDKVLWRGTTTGDSYSKRKNYDWHKSHRPRLVLMANSDEGERDIWVKRNGMWQSETWPMAELNAHWMDVALSAEPHQCNKDDGTCEEMSAELTKKSRVNHDEAAKYKCEHCPYGHQVCTDQSRCDRCGWERLVVPVPPAAAVRFAHPQVDHLSRVDVPMADSMGTLRGQWLTTGLIGLR